MDLKRERRQDTRADPVRRAEPLNRRARRTPDGALPVFEGEAFADDVRSVVMQLAARVDALTGELEEARRHVAELEAQADEDALLPILNRRGLMREIGRAIAFNERYATESALLVLSVDRLKALNQAYGHAAGDAALKAVVNCLRRQIRSSDVIGRLGLDEIGIILWTASRADAARKAADLADAVADACFAVAGRGLKVTVSAGVATIGAADTAEQVVRRAGELLGAARRHANAIRR